MANQFLNKDGVKTLWAKIKSLVSGKLDKSGGTMTGDLIISDGSKLRFANPNYGISGIYTSQITVTMSSTSEGGQCNTTATAPSNSGDGKWYLLCLPTGPYSEWYTCACNGQGLDNNGTANIYCMRIKTGPVFTCTIRLIWVKIW